MRLAVDCDFFSQLSKVLLGEELYGNGNLNMPHERQAERDTYLSEWLHMESTEWKLLREHFMSFLGIPEGEGHRKDTSINPLDVLTASNLLSGPFTINFSDRPSEHLTFNTSGGQATIKLLAFDKIFYSMYIPQRIGIARSVIIFYI